MLAMCCQNHAVMGWSLEECLRIRGQRRSLGRQGVLLSMWRQAQRVSHFPVEYNQAQPSRLHLRHHQLVVTWLLLSSPKAWTQIFMP